MSAFETATNQFRDAIAKLGVTPPDKIEADGKIHRFATNGALDNEAGWYVFYDGAIATGAFGDFRSGKTVGKWVADTGRELTPVEQSDFAKQQAELKAQREADTAQRQEDARQKAAGMLRYAQPAPDSHPYLARKNVPSIGLRQWKDLLLVPMLDKTGCLHSLQLISGDGGKKFLAGGRTQGCYYTLGKLGESETVFIAEGYATAATIREVTGHPTVAAFYAHNLKSVAQAIREQKPLATIFLCADDDWRTEGNPGMTKAQAAADAIGGYRLAPEFGDNRPEGATDFNDMAAHGGKAAVTNFFTGLSARTSKPIKASNENEQAAEQAAVFSDPSAPEALRAEREAVAAAKHPAAARSAPASEPAPEIKAHFSGEEFEAVQKIWHAVKRLAASHSEAGYNLLIDDKIRVEITQDRIKLSGRAKHRPDAAYAAACEHARHFWNGQMEVQGDTAHRIKTWAYAQAQGVKVTNYTPSGGELIEAQKILKGLGEVMEPEFRRPASVRPASVGRNAARPSV